MIVVIPASSNSGAQCVADLVSAGASTRAVYRSEAKAASAKEKYPALEVVSGVDANEPGEKLEAAFQGCDFAVIVTPHYDFAKDAELTCNMVEAAKSAGVKHVVFVGSWTVVKPECTIAKRFVPTEDLLRNSSTIKWTALRSGYFCGNYSGLFKSNVVYFPEVTIPPVDPKDIGRVAAAVCLDPDSDRHDQQYYDISGPEQLTTKQIVDIVSKATGREFEYHAVPVAGLEPPNPPVFLIELIQHIDAHGLPCSDVVKKLTGAHTTFDEYIAEHLEEFNP